MAAPSGATPILGLPYPIPNDDVDVPRDIKALADKLDATKSIRATSVLASAPVLDVGQLGQVRAGRQLTVADFTSMGLSAPAGLWNLSDLTDVSGNARALTNKGAVPFGVGINGQAVTAAAFAGSTGQALYIADTGAADPFRIKTGSWGCWFRTAKRGIQQTALSKFGSAAPLHAFELNIGASNALAAFLSFDGSNINGSLGGSSDVADDRWHLGVVTYDASVLRLYVDGALDGRLTLSGVIFGGAAPLNIGARGADAATVSGIPSYGRVDEAFVTADVLSDDQVRALYCASLVHSLGVAPSTVSLSVRRKRRGAALSVSDFPLQPVRLYNFVAGSLADQGSSNIPLVANPGTGTITDVAAADGTAIGAKAIYGATAGLSASDAGLPAALTARSYGCWFKTNSINAAIMGWGTYSTGHDILYINNSAGGPIGAQNVADNMTGPGVSDGLWHFAVVTQDNAASDAVKRKMYVEGRLVAGSTVFSATVLGGANRFRIGEVPTGGPLIPFNGHIDGAFVYAGALTGEQVRTLYNAGPTLLAASPKASADHIETLEATRMLATFDAIEPSDFIDVGVAA